MANCAICKAFDDQELENNPELTENSPNYKPDDYFYWHGDISENYDMGEHNCLCENCFFVKEY